MCSSHITATTLEQAPQTNTPSLRWGICLLCCFSFSAKGHACCGCSLTVALTAPRRRCHLFVGSLSIMPEHFPQKPPYCNISRARLPVWQRRLLLFFYYIQKNADQTSGRLLGRQESNFFFNIFCFFEILGRNPRRWSCPFPYISE